MTSEMHSMCTDEGARPPVGMTEGVASVSPEGLVL